MGSIADPSYVPMMFAPSAKKTSKAVFSPSFCPHISASERFTSSLSGSNRELLMKIAVRSPAFRPQAFRVTEWICIRRLRPKGVVESPIPRRGVQRLQPHQLIRSQSTPFGGIFLPLSGKPLKLASRQRIYCDDENVDFRRQSHVKTS